MTLGGQTVLLANAPLTTSSPSTSATSASACWPWPASSAHLHVGRRRPGHEKSCRGYVLIERSFGNGSSPNPAGYAHEPDRHRDAGHGCLIHPLLPCHLLSKHHPDPLGRCHYHHLFLHALRRRISSIAFTGNEPVSGMTIFMIIVSAVLMGNAGMSGSSGIIAILMMAAFLCATLAVAGNFMSELKSPTSRAPRQRRCSSGKSSPSSSPASSLSVSSSS